MLYKSIIILSALAYGLMPARSLAHVKWFVDTEQTTTVQAAHFQLSEPMVMIWISVMLIIITIGIGLELWPPYWTKRLQQQLLSYRLQAMRIFDIVCAVGLSVQAFYGYTIAPVFHPSQRTGITIATIVIVLLLLIQRWKWLACALLISIYKMTAWEFGWMALGEHLYIVGIGLWWILTDRRFQSMIQWSRETAQQWGLASMRWTLGISLIWLGLQEKIIHPELSLSFLETHHWNFMQQLGISWFDDRLFTLSAGMTEILFGIVFLLGLVTRLNTVVLTIFFLTTAVVLGLHEITGHFLLFGIAGLFIILGAHDGKTLPALIRRR
jgi:uncharacterized membrane protein YphA (DoxX/SURF4 family)/uncharacterized protein YjeT (DUF2065 family)